MISRDEKRKVAEILITYLIDGIRTEQYRNVYKNYNPKTVVEIKKKCMYVLSNIEPFFRDKELKREVALKLVEIAL